MKKSQGLGVVHQSFSRVFEELRIFEAKDQPKSVEDFVKVSHFRRSFFDVAFYVYTQVFVKTLEDIVKVVDWRDDWTSYLVRDQQDDYDIPV